MLDCDGKRLRDIDLALENDELIIKDSSGKIIDYTIPAHKRIESHIIQKAIFYTKREIIEHCLFGVDINPSSVEICKLRLWIELLKYSYYEKIATREIQTLPNIDINIKYYESFAKMDAKKLLLDSNPKRLFEKTKDLCTYQGKMDIWYHLVGKGLDLVQVLAAARQSNPYSICHCKNLQSKIVAIQKFSLIRGLLRCFCYAHTASQ